MIGKIISNYKITDFVEEGGMGTIYKGSHIKLERAVAIKILHQNLTSNPQFKERFLNEAKILAKLSHPNIINIYDFIEQDGQYYIVAEFVEGKPLDKLISGNQINSIELALQLFRQILSGIGYAHSNGVVHRDIKPSNIMIQSDNTVKILDFGIAKLSDSSKSLTKTGTKMGSLYYMSPEQVLGQNLDSRTDIYSLGIVLFEMLTHRLPYNTQTESDYELMNSILSQELPDIDSFISGLEPNIGSIIRKACAKDPNERFFSCGEFSSALNNDNYNYTKVSSDYGKTQFIEQQNIQNKNQRTVFQQPDQLPDVNTHKQNQKSKNTGILILFGALIAIIIIVTIFLVTKNNDSELTASNNNSNTSSQSSTTTNSQGTENSNTGSNTYNNSGNSSDKSSTNYSSSPVIETARGFINDLGSQNFRSAFEKQRNKGWGTYENFSSIKSFGGITATSINDASVNYEYADAASVFIDYYSYDPYNKDGRYKQNFIMKKYPDGWKIMKIENVKIEQWKK